MGVERDVGGPLLTTQGGQGRTEVLAAELEAAEGRFRRIIDTTTDAIVVVGDEGVVRFANPAACDLFGRPAGELEGHLFGFPIAAGDDTEVDILPRNGEQRVAEMRVVDSEWQGDRVLLASLRDITDRKRLAELRSEQAETRAQRAEAEIATRRIQLLADGGALLASSLSLPGPLERFTRLLVPRLADWCLVVLTRESMEAGRRSAFYAHADPAAEAALEDLIPLYRSDRLEDVFTGEPELVTDGEAWLAQRDADIQDLFEAAGFASGIHLPVVVADHVVGCMTLARSGRPMPPTALSGPVYESPDLTLAREFGRRIGLALENARLFRQAENASRMRDEFMAKVSHEMRTPLQAILGWTSILKADESLESKDASRLRRGIEVIERNAQNQVHLIEDILDVSRIITGKLSLERELVEVRKVVEAALETLEPAAAKKQIEVRDLGETRDGRLVHADPYRLQQVVINLVGNAIKYTPEGGWVEVSIQGGGAEDEDEVVIRVRDNGLGISPKVLPYVFNPFRQGRAEATGNLSGDGSGGLGLGLAIVRQLVEIHSGEVTAESDGLGQGATFTVRLPAANAEGKAKRQRPIIPASPSTPGAHQDLSGIRLAVVDDEADARDLMETALTDLGALTWTAGSSADFFQRLEEEAAAGRLPEVLISDIGMPGEDGYALLRRLRELDPKSGSEIPAVALTGFARPEDVRRAEEAGFERHLAKPVTLAHLAAIVAELAGQE